MRTFMVTTLVAILAGSQGASAQDRPQQDRDARKDRDVRTISTSEGKIDSQLANCLAIDNWAEIELAKFAENKTKSEEVKQLAQMLQKDHSQFLSRLKEIEPNITQYVGVDGIQPRTVRKPVQAIDERRDPNATNTGREGQRKENLDRTVAYSGANEAQLMQIKQEIAQACVNTLKEELGAKANAEFDHCFVGYQVGAHMRMLDTLKVFERHASPQLAQVINDVTPTVQSHLDHAKQCLTQCESKLTRTEKSTSKDVK